MATSNGDKKNINFPKVHCFICSQCSYANEHGLNDASVGKNFRRILQKICTRRFPKGQVLIKQISCLGFCKDGISSVIYPQKIINTGLREGQESNVADLITQLLNTLG